MVAVPVRKQKGTIMNSRTRQGSPAGLEWPLIFGRPDGFYWQAAAGEREYGPFATLIEAEMDLECAGVDAAESLREAGNEIGIADWIDPETGEPAEDSVPHLEDGVV